VYWGRGTWEKGQVIWGEENLQCIAKLIQAEKKAARILHLTSPERNRRGMIKTLRKKKGKSLGNEKN